MNTHDIEGYALQVLSIIYDSETLDDAAIGRLGEAVDAVLDLVDDKLGAVRAVTLRFRNEEEVIGKEIARLTARRRAVKLTGERISDLAVTLMGAHHSLTGEKSIKRHGWTATLQSRSRIDGPSEADKWPPWCQRVTVEPDKMAAKAVLEAAPDVLYETHREDLAAAGVRLGTTRFVVYR